MTENAGPTGVALRVEGTFRLRDVFGMSFGIFGRHFGVCIALAAIVLCPFYLALLAAVVLRPDGNLRSLLPWITVMPMVVICPTIATGAMTYCVIQDLRGRPVRMLETLKVLVRRLLPMMGVAISLLPLVPVSLLLAFIVTRTIAVFFPLVGADPRYSVGSLVLFLILGFCICFAAAPVCIAEQAGIGVSLSRSRFLTKGHRWQIFGAFTVIFVIDVIVSVMARLVASRIGADADLVGADTGRLIASYIVQAVFLGFVAVVAAVFYHQLRIVKDGGLIASVFD
jgi:hypothetical protein